MNHVPHPIAALPQLRALLVGLNTLSGLCIGLLLPGFPDGHFVPRWSRWPIILGTLYHEGLSTFFPALLAASPLLSGLDAVEFVGGMLFLIAVQTYRYRRVSTPVQRQQTKWAIFGFIVAMAGFSTAISLGTLFFLIHHGFVFFSLLFIPLSIGLAILRSHLWDSDWRSLGRRRNRGQSREPAAGGDPHGHQDAGD